jgi:uncharacterized protein (TIGR02996 family)
MTDRDSLLTAVLETPADDTARLVLADFLEENGEDEFGRFLRAGVTASRFRDDPVIDDPAYYDALHELSDVASAGQPAQWVSALGLGPSPLSILDWGWDNTADKVAVRLGAVIADFERGMLAGLTLTLGEWYDVAGGALTSWPLERATIRDVLGLSFRVSSPTPARPGWVLTGVLKCPPRRVRLTGESAVDQSLSPVPFLVEPADELKVEDGFLTRGELVTGVAAASVRVVDELREMAGDRWPSPPRRNRRGL